MRIFHFTSVSIILDIHFFSIDKFLLLFVYSSLTQGDWKTMKNSPPPKKSPSLESVTSVAVQNGKVGSEGDQSHKKESKVRRLITIQGITNKMMKVYMLHCYILFYLCFNLMTISNTFSDVQIIFLFH